MKKIFIAIQCWFSGHDWTCHASEGIKPTESEKAGGIMGFHHYARMYCKRCTYISPLSRDSHNSLANDSYL